MKQLTDEQVAILRSILQEVIEIKAEMARLQLLFDRMFTLNLRQSKKKAG